MSNHVQTKSKKSKKPAHDVDAPIPFKPAAPAARANPSGYISTTETPAERVLEALNMGCDRPEVGLAVFIAQTIRLVNAADEGDTILDSRYLLTMEYLTEALADMIEHTTVRKAVA